MSKKIDNVAYHVSFSGDIGFLQWVLEKYKNELPYCGSLYVFCRELHYEKTSVENWKRFGIGKRVWDSLHQSITLSYLMGKISNSDFKSLENLKEEYNLIIKETQSSIQSCEEKLAKCRLRASTVRATIEDNQNKLAKLEQEEQDLSNMINRSEIQLKLYKREMPERDNALKVKKRYSKTIKDKIKNIVANYPSGCSSSQIKRLLQEKPSSVKNILYRMVQNNEIKKVGQHPNNLYKLSTIN